MEKTGEFELSNDFLSLRGYAVYGGKIVSIKLQEKKNEKTCSTGNKIICFEK